MSTEINVTVDSGGLLERSKLQTAANRQAFVEGQQRANAEQTGKEQRLERLAAEGRDAQGSLILPNRARQSALDRFTPQPAARRNAAKVDGFIWVIDGTITYGGFNDDSIFGGVYKNKISPANVYLRYPNLSATDPLNATGFSYAESGYTRTIGVGLAGESALYIAPTNDYDAPYLNRGFTGPAFPPEVPLSSDLAGFTYIANVNPLGVGGFFTMSVILLINGGTYSFVCGLSRTGTGAPEVYITVTYPSLNTVNRTVDALSDEWHQVSFTLTADSAFMHIDGRLLLSMPSGLGSQGQKVYAISNITLGFDSEVAGGTQAIGMGTVRLTPRPLFGGRNYTMRPILSYR